MEYIDGEARFHAFLSSRQMEVGSPSCISHFNQPGRVPRYVFRARCLINMNTKTMLIAYQPPIHINISDFLILHSTISLKSIYLHNLVECFNMLRNSKENFVLLVLGHLACFPSDLT
jgi:hypothetical protein